MNDSKRTLESNEVEENKKISFSIDVGGGKKLRLIDISTEDDYLIASPFFDSLEDLRLSVTLDSKNAHESLKPLRIGTSLSAQNAAEIVQQSDHKFLSSDSMEPGRPSYLRKSLAWDNAFFTNAGVLDPDELLLMNKGFKSRPLLGIQEDVSPWKSESSTIKGCDRLKLECFEGHLFEDVRASIQRSSEKFNAFNASRGPASRQAGLKNVQGPKRVGNHSRMKHIPVFGGQSIPAQQLAKSRNESSRCGQHHILPLKRPKVESGLVKDSSTGKSGTALMGKEPDPITIELKSARKRSVQSLMGCKKLSSSVSVATEKSSNLSCSLYDIPRRAVSPDVPSNQLKRKIESRKSKLSASVSTSRTPLRYSGKSKQLENLSLSTMSMSSHSSGQSPASSTRSLIPSRKKHSHVLTPDLDITIKARKKCLQTESRQPSDMQRNLRYQSSSHEESEMSSPSQLQKVCATGACLGPTESVESLQRSGLRMPSPKIGFFDEDKAGIKKLRGNLQFPPAMQSASPKKRGDTSRKMPAKLTKLATAEARNLKHVYQDSETKHQNSRLQPRHATTYEKLKRDSPVGSGFMRSLPDRAANRYNKTPTRIEGGNCFKTRKIDAGEGNQRKTIQNSSLRIEDRKPEATSGGKAKNKASKGQKSNGSIHHHTKSTAKSNSSCNDAQVNELSKFLEVIDLNRDMIMEGEYKSSYIEENILHNQLQDFPDSPLSVSSPLPFTEVIFSTKTPLQENKSVCNTRGTCELFMDSTREKSADKHQPYSPFDDIDKENI